MKKLSRGDITEEQKDEKLEKVQNGDIKKSKEKAPEVTTQKVTMKQEEKAAEVIEPQPTAPEVTTQIEQNEEVKPQKGSGKREGGERGEKRERPQ